MCSPGPSTPRTAISRISLQTQTQQLGHCGSELEQACSKGMVHEARATRWGNNVSEQAGLNCENCIVKGHTARLDNHCKRITPRPLPHPPQHTHTHTCGYTPCPRLTGGWHSTCRQSGRSSRPDTWAAHRSGAGGTPCIGRAAAKSTFRAAGFASSKARGHLDGHWQGLGGRKAHCDNSDAAAFFRKLGSLRTPKQPVLPGGLVACLRR